ncbi:hypothetical protein [Desulfonema magnum]|uniref:Uncharacterized protein n=1 Tax=Desulfonema magnum TaxID=45655 RepID=A0A975BU44_9BACT|nr:hypothetical protein [Desulfonema magnum]QTA91865.1 Uncharacterized protein dnm_079390 [Desulfonema magnum]
MPPPRGVTRLPQIRYNQNKFNPSAYNQEMKNSHTSRSHASRHVRRTDSGREASALHSHAKRGNEIAGGFFPSTDNVTR